MFKDSSEVLDFIKKENVEFVDVRFMDLPGVMQHFNDLVPDCTVTGDPDRAGSMDRHGHAFDFFQIGVQSHRNQNCTRLHLRLRPLGRGKDSAVPLPDD